MLETFLESLRASPGADDVFNPWWESDPDHDAFPEAQTVRRDNLRRYLAERKNARLLVLAEAVGYQGGHFTGMAMTSERILLGHRRKDGIAPEDVLRGEHRRTSREDLKRDGFNEPTATVVWGHLLRSGVDARDFVLWNIFPWHPYHRARGMLTNRTPTREELVLGGEMLRRFLGLFDFRHILAVGNKSHETLAEMGIATRRLRHPANGGAKRFRAEFDEFLHEYGTAPRRDPA